MSRVMTPAEVRARFIEEIQMAVQYWGSLNVGPMEIASCTAFSVLNILDGCTSLPTFDVVARTCPDDVAVHKADGDDWIEDGTVINADTMLHDELYGEH